MNHLNALIAGLLSLALLGADPATQPTRATGVPIDPRVYAGKVSDLKARLPNATAPNLRGGMLVVPERQVDRQMLVVPPFVTPRSEWVAKQFNGLTYYLIPCNAAPADVVASGGKRFFENFGGVAPATPLVSPPTTRPVGPSGALDVHVPPAPSK